MTLGLKAYRPSDLHGAPPLDSVGGQAYHVEKKLAPLRNGQRVEDEP